MKRGYSPFDTRGYFRTFSEFFSTSRTARLLFAEAWDDSIKAGFTKTVAFAKALEAAGDQ